MTKYLFLFGAIFCEVVGTLLLPVSQNFTKLVPTVTLALFYLCAFFFLTFAIKSIPLPIVYATWSGLGVFSIAIFSYIFYKQALNWQIIAGLFLIIIGVVIVNLYSSKVI
jgi:multidrug transporter EmrE-like cation transporter